MKIGIVTFYASANFGAVLQCYALQQVLIKQGHDVSIINRKYGNYDFPKYRFSRIKKILFPNYFNKFRLKYLHLTKHIACKEDLDAVEERYDVILAGSDQVWNCDCINIMGYYFYLDWVSEKTKKISYAASFGKDKFDVSEEKIKRVKELLSLFSYVSVRENSGVNICNELFSVNAQQDLDPTLLLEAKEYGLITKLKQKHKPYLCKFFLDSSLEKEDFVNNISLNKQLKIVNIYPHVLNKWKGIFHSKYRLPSIGEWLKGIHNADLIITDSFHGVVFSILFNKEFICINNKERGSARFESLLSLLNIKDRLVNIEDPIQLSKAIDYREVNKLLKNARVKSINNLINAL
ncbi:polysaccharide pyruvyl transferase family protein [Ancylomarina sp. 16SWW S1-10-2]|uniref:polysaccharide pyruvyl transferase family protein n=1 Tax=Ancylomarina sp. 16SWW S1-10-2 TaxID=2499681 RepID=UPI0012AE35B0|nr:polysaccharide pyruvyl transferase family protein [Ancylomarina sp. 16SWW S1-10-2]MRT91922.1 polysaccharide pyruvyl transferase family protein [Ancylomarina sp. 16SWW S1-10-2]